VAPIRPPEGQLGKWILRFLVTKTSKNPNHFLIDMTVRARDDCWTFFQPAAEIKVLEKVQSCAGFDKWE
jgi:hypothetical protein